MIEKIIGYTSINQIVEKVNEIIDKLNEDGGE